MSTKTTAEQAFTPEVIVARLGLTGVCIAGTLNHNLLACEEFAQAAEALTKLDGNSYEGSLSQTLHAVMDYATVLSLGADSDRILEAGLSLVCDFEEKLSEDNLAVKRANAIWDRKHKDGFHDKGFQDFLRESMTNPNPPVSERMREALNFKSQRLHLNLD